MNVVMIVPTGIGAEIGGHAGDATPAARLLGAVSDTLVLHPNVVNASDINEMPGNALYVDGAMLDRFLEGKTSLRRVKSNRVLVVVNAPVKAETIDAVSAARATLGLVASIMVLDTPLVMTATMKDGIATGEVTGWRELLEQVETHNFDALAIATPVTVSREVSLDYLRNGGINPWGGVEAKASRLIANDLQKPVAHAPVDDGDIAFTKKVMGEEIVDPRMSAEMISTCFLHCVLKGLHKAPQQALSTHHLSRDDIDCLVTPVGCVGRPHRACMVAGIPIIAVKENTTVLTDPMPGSFILVENYLEAAGVIAAMGAGISLGSVRRPLAHTEVIGGNNG